MSEPRIEITSELPPDKQARLDELTSWLVLLQGTLQAEGIEPAKIVRVMNRLVWGNPDGYRMASSIYSELLGLIGDEGPVAYVSSDDDRVLDEFLKRWPPVNREDADANRRDNRRNLAQGESAPLGGVGRNRRSESCNGMVTNGGSAHALVLQHYGTGSRSR